MISSMGKDDDIAPLSEKETESRGERFDRGSFDRSTYTSRENLDNRAVGDFSENNRTDWANGTSASLLCTSESLEKQNDFFSSLLDARETRNSTLNFFQPDLTMTAEGSFVSTNATERATNWAGGEVSSTRSSSSTLDTVLDFAGGVADFVANYNAMKDANTKGADRYFHCMANCEATERGPGGEAAALLISYGREAIDLPKNVATKGLSFKEAINDGKSDLEANRIGREGINTGVRCTYVCRNLKPRSL